MSMSTSCDVPGFAIGVRMREVGLVIISELRPYRSKEL